MLTYFLGRSLDRREAMVPPARFPGVDKDVLRLLESNMDQAPARRRAREAFKDIQLDIDYILFKVHTYTNSVAYKH